MTKMKRLENKTILITGGLSGIGRACAVEAAIEGANIVVADIRSVALDSAMQDIKSENEKATFIECDVTKANQVQEAVASCIKLFGTIDVALNNAGVSGESSRIGEITEEGWNSTINVNLTGVFNCMKYELLHMASQKKGSIINMSSVLGLVGYRNSAAYVAAKHAIIGLTKTAALEYAPENIRVNAICPGFIDTPMLVQEGIKEDEKAKTQIKNLHALDRFGKPEEIAKGFIFLASDDSSFVTGSALAIDGGYLAH